jgi:hypothetical protein
MTTKIGGNTYPVRGRLREMGGRWNPAEKVWEVPDSRADEARQLVGSAPRQAIRPQYSPETAREYRVHECGCGRRSGIAWTGTEWVCGNCM